MERRALSAPSAVLCSPSSMLNRIDVRADKRSSRIRLFIALARNVGTPGRTVAPSFLVPSAAGSREVRPDSPRAFFVAFAGVPTLVTDTGLGMN